MKEIHNKAMFVEKIFGFSTGESVTNCILLLKGGTKHLGPTTASTSLRNGKIVCLFEYTYTLNAFFLISRGSTAKNLPVLTEEIFGRQS